MLNIEPLRWMLACSFCCKHAGECASSIRTKSWARHERCDRAFEVTVSQFIVRNQERLSSGTGEPDDGLRYPSLTAAGTGSRMVGTGPSRLDLLVSDIFNPESKQIVELVWKRCEVRSNFRFI